MKTKQLVLHSAVTIVATGLTLLSSSTSEASGRGPSGMRMSAGRGGMSHMSVHQGLSNRGERMATMNRMERRDDRGGHGERERRHGHDDGIRHDGTINRGERERERRGQSHFDGRLAEQRKAAVGTTNRGGFHFRPQSQALAPSHCLSRVQLEMNFIL